MSGLLPNALHVARREYLFRVQGRAFVVSTALLAAAVAILTLLPTFLSAIGVDDPPEIAVRVEADDLVSDPVISLQLLFVAADAGTGTPGASPEPSAPASETSARITRADDPEAAADAVRAGELDGLLTILRGTDGDLVFEYLSDASPTSQTRILVNQASTAMTIEDRLDRAGISAGESAEIFAPTDFSAVAANPDAFDEENFVGSYLLGYGVVILTFMAILTYGNWVAQSVAEEKSGRVMELLITAATPRQLLTGKVFGTGAAGLTQYLAMVAAVVIGLAANAPVANLLGVASNGLPFAVPELTPFLIVSFAVLFLLGFLLYATLYAAAGSMVSRIEDVQQAAGPLIFLAMGGYLASFAGLNDPSADWVAILSLVPFFSPYLMPARMLLSTVAPGEVLLAIGLLVASLAVALWVAARIYSAGVLMYGQRVGIRTILRATRVSR